MTVSGPVRSGGEADLALRVDGMLPRPVDARIVTTGEDAFAALSDPTFSR